MTDPEKQGLRLDGEKRTTIRVPESLKAELDGLKLIPDETYMSVIRRLIDDYQRTHKTR